MRKCRKAARSARRLQREEIPNGGPGSTGDGGAASPPWINADLAQVLPLAELVPQEPDQSLPLGIRVWIVFVEPQAVEHRNGSSNGVVERDHARLERFQVCREPSSPHRCLRAIAEPRIHLAPSAV